jgi:hypothetical protein
MKLFVVSIMINSYGDVSAVGLARGPNGIERIQQKWRKEGFDEFCIKEMTVEEEEVSE